MFKIGEFSRLTQVTIRMLRHYDETGLLKPAFIDPQTGYRLYSCDQIPILNKIIYLRDSGFKIAEIADILKQPDAGTLILRLDQKAAEVNALIETEKEKLKKLTLAREALLKDRNELHYQIVTRFMPELSVLSLRAVIPTYYDEGALWRKLSDYALKNKIEFSGDCFSVYHDMEYKEQDVDVEVCIETVEPVRDCELSGGFSYRTLEAVPVMACMMVVGDFSNIAGAYLSFAHWLQAQGKWKMGSANRQIVHRGPWNEADPQKFLIELQIPLEII